MKQTVTAAETLVIEHLEVDDEVTLAYIQQLEPDAQADGVLNCLQLGARAFTFAGDQNSVFVLAEAMKTTTEATRSVLDNVSKTAQLTVTKSVEELPKQIHRELDKLSKDLEHKLDPANMNSIIGRFRKALLSDYKTLTTQLKNEMDFANPLSPFSTLHTNIEKKHNQLLKQLTELMKQGAATDAARVERAKSSRKGLDLEAALEVFLTAESRPRKDLLRRTGTESGLDGNQIGDFVIEINPSEAAGVRLVIEAKNAVKSPASLMRELDKAMKNRGAAFGIAVVTEASTAAHAIMPYGDDKLLVRCPALPDRAGWDTLALSIALEGARWKALMSRAADGRVDVKRMQADIEGAFHIANRFTEVKKRITTGKTHLDGIAEYLDDLRRDLVTVLQRLREAAVESGPKALAA